MTRWAISPGWVLTLVFLLGFSLGEWLIAWLHAPIVELALNCLNH